MDERQKLELAIAAQESLRGTLDDAVIDVSIAALKQQLAALDSPPQQQRKLATILFTDIVGSTRLTQGLDPEEEMALIDPLIQRLAARVSEHGGHVCRYEGDCFKAVFGLPVAHENDPAQAIRAGLAIQSEAARIAEELETERGLAGFQVRVGLSTGLVFSGGETEGEDTIKGEPVNLAKRLESAAQPATVLISHDSYKHVRGMFNVESLEPIQVKGFSEPVVVYRVLRAKARPFYRGMRGVEGVETRMVGREPEFLQLQKILEDVIEDGLGQMVTVVGGAGLGKSRMLYEFENWVDLQPEVWLFKGRARLETQGLPYGLLRDLFALQFGIQDDDSAQAVRDKLETGIGEVFGGGEESEKKAHIIGQLLGYAFQDSPHLKEFLDNPQQLRDQAVMYMVGYFKSLAVRDPVLVLLEDLHWADEASLDALNSLAMELRDQPVFILATARHGLLERRPHWGEGQDFHRHILLEPLSKRESRKLVAEVLQRVQDVPELLSELVVSNAEGNPFYVEELVKMLVEDGVIVRDDPHWRVETGRLEETHVPPTLTGVLQARLDGLPEEERKALQGASVIGRVFWDQILEYINGSLEDRITERQVVEVLDELRSRELIFRRETSAFAEANEHIFKHALLREVTYESVLKRVRQAYHALVAEWLIEHAGDREDEFTGLIGDHLKLADSNARACQYLIKAGDRARSIFAHEEAISSYRQAVDFLIEAGETAKAARTLMKLGLTYHSNFQFTEACQTYDQAFNLWEQAGWLEEGETLPPAPHAYRFLLSEPNSLDPKIGIGTSLRFHENIFSGLVELTSGGEVIPDVAQRWEVLDEGRRYVFYLREDVTWSDGVPVTAHDIEYAWKRGMDPVSGAVQVEAYFIIKNAEAYHQGDLGWEAVGVHAKDDFTLEVELVSPSISFLYLLSWNYFFPVPRHAVEKHGPSWTNPENLVTNGPFRLIEWHPGKSIHLGIDPNFSGRFPGNLQQIDIYFLDDVEPEARLEMYADDRIDAVWIGFLPNPKRARSQYADEFRTAPVLITQYIGFNTEQPPLDDPRVRKALALATDRETLIKSVYEGLGVFPATGGLLPPGMPGHTEGIALPYDPAKARRLLAEAGYPDGRGFPVIKVRFAFNPEYNEILQTQWQDNLGIEIRWIDLPFDQYCEQRKDLHAWIITNWADYPDPQSFLDGPVPDSTGWFHEKYNELIHRASAMMDYQERLKLYRQAERILIEEVPLLPIGYARWDLLVKPWVRRLPFSPTKGWYWKEIILEPWETEQGKK